MTIHPLAGLLGAAILWIAAQAAYADEPMYKYDPTNPESRIAMAECEHKLPDKATNAQRMACYQKEMKYRGERLLYDAKQLQRALNAQLDRCEKQQRACQNGGDCLMPDCPR